MKFIHRTGVFALLGILVAAAVGSADPPSVVGRLSLTMGPVSFLPGSLDEWAPAVLNYPLGAGDHLWTDQGGRAEVHVGSAALRLDSGTEMSFLTLDDQVVQVRLSQGSLNVRLRQIAPGETWEIDTPNSVVTLLAPGTYRVDATPAGEVDVIVRTGQAEVAAAVDVFDVPARSSAHISGTDSVVYYLQPAPQPDSWDAWCSSRDAREDRVVSIRYVSREMIGVEDLDDNGVWITVAIYGTVWAPSRVPTGWAPYRFGRWAWVPPWGWTWIDNAPWGFAPFHYGRWAFVQSRWVWIPGGLAIRPVYAPALVVFVGGTSDDTLGWFPLGPREIYVPTYQASPVYVQRLNAGSVANVTPQVIQRFDVVHTPYVNRLVPSAVTMVPRQVLVQSRPVSEAPVAPGRIDVQRLPVTGMAAPLTPQRESVLVMTPGTTQRPVFAPPQAALSRPVYTRTTPAPQPQPFAPIQAPPGAGGTQPAAPPPAGQPVQQPVGPGIIVISPSNRIQAPPTQPTPATPMTQQPVVQQPTTQQPVVQQPSPQQPGAQAPTAQKPAGAAGQDVASLLDKLDKQSLRDLQRHLESTRNIKGISLDYKSLQKQIEDLRKALNDAQKALKAGKQDEALRAANDIQRKISDLDKLITDAEQAATKGNDQGQKGQQGQQQGGGVRGPSKP